MIGGRLGIPELLIILILFGIFSLTIIAWWRFFSKAGYPGPLSLTMLIPLASIIVFFWFAFAEWPIERKLKPPQI